MVSVDFIQSFVEHAADNFDALLRCYFIHFSLFFVCCDLLFVGHHFIANKFHSLV
jgi:hypothetical protein